ncbi:hypothetical protein AMATHDRAFT_63426 [Amanita thiersii Skay4041]|uniref:G-protein coupled receptors family 1 profile domain-containing protein n=1 Tax=Amanita thiersii Skay4041 TaxID=703135 RepID=A0A2A9NEC7_9AGAR|nr:hypothetical protein AMATHDRAFT_63426 [Amanita thiersii Skay4041]
MSTPIGAMIIATFTQSLLFGIYLPTCIHCVRWLVFTDVGWKFRKDIKWVMLSATLSIFVLMTLNVTFAIKASLDLLTKGIMRSYAHVIMLVSERLTTVITDYILMYRCWTVYGNSWRIVIIPFFLWLATVICTVIGVQWVVVVLHTSNTRLSIVTSNANLAFFTCTIIINVWLTTAIVLRIWHVARKSIGSAGQFYSVIQIIIESGLMYTVTSLMLLIAAIIGRRPRFSIVLFPRLLLAVVNCSIAAIAFNLLVIRSNEYRVQHPPDATTLPNSNLSLRSADNSAVLSRDLGGATSPSVAANLAHGKQRSMEH